MHFNNPIILFERVREFIVCYLILSSFLKIVYLGVYIYRFGSIIPNAV